MIVQSTQRLNHIAEVHSVHVRSKQPINDHDVRCRYMRTELVRRAQHIRGMQRRTHRGEGVRHVVA
jgi:hypothetical protein